MSLALRTWLAAARTRARLTNRLSPARDRLELVRAHAPGRSFADVGCMWGVHGQIAFTAEEAQASSVSAVDIMQATPQFLSEHERRRSSVRFLSGDVHDEDLLERLGPHEVVWCSGVVYHAPHPLLTLQRLRGITTETLILSSEVIPELPGIAQACVFLPFLPEDQRKAHAGLRASRQVGLSTPFQAEQRYANWYWGLTASALAAMLRTAGFEPLQAISTTLHATFVARPVDVNR